MTSIKRLAATLRPTQLRKLRSIATEILESYDLGQSKIRLLRYEDNAVYFVSTYTGEKYSLRYSIKDGHSADAQLAEVELLLHLNQSAKVRVPQPIPNIKGEYVTSASFVEMSEPTKCVLFSWIDGKVDPAVSGAHLASKLGRVMGELHEAMHAYGKSGSGERHVQDVNAVLQNGITLTHGKDRLSEIVGGKGLQHFKAAVDLAASQLSGLFNVDDLSHADLHLENVIDLGHELAIIDFDDTAYCDAGFDVATALSSVYRRCGSDKNFYNNFASELLENYSAVRNGLLPASLQSFDALLVMRDMVITNFITTSSNPTVEQWGPQRVLGISDSMAAYAKSGKYIGGIEVPAKFH